MRLPKQAHKNANPDSRQTNQLQNEYKLTQKPELAFYQIQTFTWQKKGILSQKENYTYFAIFDLFGNFIIS